MRDKALFVPAFQVSATGSLYIDLFDNVGALFYVALRCQN